LIRSPTYVLNFNCGSSTINHPSESSPSVSDTKAITVAPNAPPPTEKHTKKKKYYVRTNVSSTSLPCNIAIVLWSHFPVVALYKIWCGGIASMHSYVQETMQCILSRSSRIYSRFIPKLEEIGPLCV
jgi:hypothetical protein